MKRGKYEAPYVSKRHSSKKVLAMLLSLVLVIGCVAGGTLAWLVAKTTPVTNTFSVGNITIELKEHTLDANGVLTTTETTAIDTYKIVPGTEQNKDPFVRVTANSEACWVFVQIKETNNTAGDSLKYVSWSIADGWTLLENSNGVSTYYRTNNYTSSADAVTYPVLSENVVSYSSDLTKTMIDALGTNKPTLTLKAFAVQSNASDTAADAWDVIDSNEKLS